MVNVTEAATGSGSKLLLDLQNGGTSELNLNHRGNLTLAGSSTHAAIGEDRGHVDTHGYVRYRNWKLYAERGLPGRPVVVWRCGDHLLIEHQDEPLAQFSVTFEPDDARLARVAEPRLFEHRASIRGARTRSGRP